MTQPTEHARGSRLCAAAPPWDIMSAMRRLALVLCLLSVAACKRIKPPHPPAAEPVERAAMRPSLSKSEGLPTGVRSLRRCFPEDASGDPPRPLDALLDRAADRHDHGDFQGALAC